MKRLVFLAVICLLASASQINAQLIIRNNGHAEIGHDPYDPVPEGLNPSYYDWLDTATVLKVFGNRGDAAAGAHMTFGDNLLINNYYEIEASGKVTLEDGFKVDKGAFFAIYPACF